MQRREQNSRGMLEYSVYHVFFVRKKYISINYCHAPLVDLEKMHKAIFRMEFIVIEKKGEF